MKNHERRVLPDKVRTVLGHLWKALDYAGAGDGCMGILPMLYLLQIGTDESDLAGLC